MPTHLDWVKIESILSVPIPAVPPKGQSKNDVTIEGGGGKPNSSQKQWGEGGNLSFKPNQAIFVSYP